MSTLFDVDAIVSDAKKSKLLAFRDCTPAEIRGKFPSCTEYTDVQLSTLKARATEILAQWEAGKNRPVETTQVVQQAEELVPAKADKTTSTALEATPQATTFDFGQPVGSDAHVQGRKLATDDVLARIANMQKVVTRKPLTISETDGKAAQADILQAPEQTNKPMDGVSLLKNLQAHKPQTCNTIQPYEVIGMRSAARMKLPQMEYIWNKMPFSDGPNIVVFGAPGRGKTRFLQCLATAQILGRDFLGEPTLHRPLRWLHVQTENGMHRQQVEGQNFLYGKPVGWISEKDELRLLSARGLSVEQAELLETHNLSFALRDPADRCIALGDEGNVNRLIATFEKHKPDVVTWDPWGDLVIDGAELDDGKIRATVQTVCKIESEAGLKNPANIFLAHARMGYAEEAKAYGGDAGNYGKNSKAIYSIARYVLNIRCASFDENPPIEIICAKNNDGTKPTPLAARLNFAIREYELIPNFDHDAWQAELENAASSGRKPRGNDVRTEKVVKVCKERGTFFDTQTEAHNAIAQKWNVSPQTARDWLEIALSSGAVMAIPKGTKNGKRIGLAEYLPKAVC